MHYNYMIKEQRKKTTKKKHNCFLAIGRKHRKMTAALGSCLSSILLYFEYVPSDLKGLGLKLQYFTE